MKLFLFFLLTAFVACNSAQAADWTPIPKPSPVKAAAAAAKSTAAIAPAAGQLTVTQIQQNPLLLLQSFTVSDLQAAIADANAQTPPDTVASNCYSAILTLVQNFQTPSSANGQIGAIYAFQKARDIKQFALSALAPTGPLNALNNTCAPLVLDVQNTLLMFGVGAGIVANPVGGVAVAGLPAAVAALLAALPIK